MEYVHIGSGAGGFVGESRVLIVQHGEKTRGVGDVPLTSRGEGQARVVAEFLAPTCVGAMLVSSPMKRAIQTLAPLASTLAAPVSLDERFRERMNLEPGVDPRVFFEDWVRATENREYQPLVGRSSAEAGAQMATALEELSCAQTLIVIASHGGVTTDALRTIFGDSEVQRIAPTLLAEGIPGGAITELHRDENGWHVVRIADVRHLAVGNLTPHNP